MYMLSLCTLIVKMQSCSLSPQIHVTLINLGRVVGAKGGVEKVFCELANQLQASGFSVNAVCCDRQEGTPGFPLSDAVNFYNCWRDDLNPFLSRPICNLRSLHTNRELRRSRRAQLLGAMYAAKLRKVLQSLKSDIFICFQPDATYVIKELLEIPQPTVTMFHMNPRFFARNPEFKLFKRSLEQSSALQVLMPEYIEECHSILPNANIIHIPNCVIPSATISKLKNKKIINIGRISKQKQQLLIVEAFSQIATTYPDWTLELWGEESENPAYSKQVRCAISKHRLEKQILLMGTTDKMQEKLLDSSIFLFPSESEGLPLALLEAMTCGLPAIGRQDCPAVNTLIQDNVNGLLASKTPASVAAALEHLMSSLPERKRMGEAARFKSLEFSPERVWGSWRELILKTLQQKQ